MTVKTHFDIADDVWYYGSNGLLYRGIVTRILVQFTVSGLKYHYSCIAFSRVDIAFSGDETEIYGSEEAALNVALKELLE